MIKEYTKEVMHNAITHHSLMQAQADPEQQPPVPTPANSPIFIVPHDTMCNGPSL